MRNVEPFHCALSLRPWRGVPERRRAAALCRKGERAKHDAGRRLVQQAMLKEEAIALAAGPGAQRMGRLS